MRVLIVFVLGVMAAAAHAEDDWKVLRNAANAGRQQVLSGTYLHQMNGGTLETFRIVRGGVGDAMREKRTSLDGPPREIVRQGSALSAYAPDARALMAAKVSAMRLFPALFPEEMDGVEQSYTIQREGNDRVAQHDCNWLELRPRDRMRYTTRMCIEPLTALPLKMVTLDPRGEAVEQFTFTELALNGPKDKKLYKPSYSLNYTLRPPGGLPKGDASLRDDISGMPSGFRLVRSVKRSLPGGTDKAVHHLVYTDGLAMLSVFVEPLTDGGRPEQSINLHGAVNMVTAPQGGYQLTAVGDMPENAMLKMVRDLKLNVH